MISEVGYLFFVMLATVLFLAGYLSKRWVLSLFSAGLYIILSFMSANVGTNEIIQVDYVYFGYILVAMGIMALLVSLVGIMQEAV